MTTTLNNERINDPTYITTMTEGYIIIPPDMYQHIMPGDHLRYVDTGGAFRTGGFVWYPRKIHNSMDPNAWVIGKLKTPSVGYCFTLDWAKIQTLWKKSPIEANMLKNAIDERHEYLVDVSLFLIKKFGKEFSDFLKDRENERSRNR